MNAKPYVVNYFGNSGSAGPWMTIEHGEEHVLTIHYHPGFDQTRKTLEDMAQKANQHAALVESNRELREALEGLLGAFVTQGAYDKQTLPDFTAKADAEIIAREALARARQLENN